MSVVFYKRAARLLALFCLAASLSASAAGPSPTPAPEAGVPGSPDHVPADGGANEVYELNQIVVTGSRTEKTQADAPVATEVVTRRELDASGAKNLAEYLENYPGLEIVHSFTGFGDGVRIQGLDPKYTMILVNGQRVIGRVDGLLDMRRFTLEGIERVEIVKGSSSALYGSDALGGVINIITRESQAPVDAAFESSFGSYDTVDMLGEVGLHKGKWNTNFYGGWHRADPFDLDTTDEATTGSGYDTFDIGNRTEFKANEIFSISSNLSYMYRDVNAIDVSGGGAIFDRYNRTESVSAELTPVAKFSADSKLSTTVYYTFFRDQLLSDQRGTTALDRYSNSLEELLQLSAQYDQQLWERQLASFGIEGAREGVESPRIIGGGTDRYRFAPYIQDEILIFKDPRWIVTPGFRFDYDSQYGDHYSPKISTRFDPVENWTVRASYGRGYRAPSFRELYLTFENPSVGYTVTGNPNLQPEQSHNINLGVEARPVKRLWSSVNFFYNEVENLITTVTLQQTPLTFGYRNTSSAYTRGIETAVHAEVLKNFFLKAGYTYLDSKDQATGRQLSDRPTNRATFSGTYRYQPWGMEAVVRGSFTGERPIDIDNNLDLIPDQTVTAPSFTNLDFRISKGFNDNFQVFAGGDNLLNEGDETFIVLRPRTFYGGVTFRWGLETWEDFKFGKKKKTETVDPLTTPIEGPQEGMKP